MSGVKETLQSGTGEIGVVGLGYVGLPLAVQFTDAGFDVRGYDIDTDRVQRLTTGDSYVGDVTDAALRAALDTGFEPSADSAVLTDCDAYVLAVPTGITPDGPELGPLKEATETVTHECGDGETLIVISSTVFPGAVRRHVLPPVDERLSDDGLVAVVPERLNPGGRHDMDQIPLVVGADDSRARAAASELFGRIAPRTHCVDSHATAALSKVLENTYRMVNIALVNQLLRLDGLDGADTWEAIEAAATKPFGFQAFWPGPGVGGHCIPIDPRFLTHRAREAGMSLDLVERAHEVNESMPDRVVSHLSTAMESRGAPDTGARIVALGVSYKPNVGDTRNSPALRVVRSLSEYHDVIAVDPHVDIELPCEHEHNLTGVDIETADAVVLLVNHDAVDLTPVERSAQFVFDTRNVFEQDAISGELTTFGGPP